MSCIELPHANGHTNHTFISIWLNHFKQTEKKIELFFYSSRLFRDDQNLVIIGVIGKSMDAACNKMAGFDMIKFAPESDVSVQNGQIKFYFNESEGKSLYIHFQTTFDEMVMEQFLMEQLAKAANDTKEEQTTQEKRNSKHRNSAVQSLHTMIRSKFAQILLFAIQVCHIIVLVEPNNVFDTAYLSIFKALKVIRWISTQIVWVSWF